MIFQRIFGGEPREYWSQGSFLGGAAVVEYRKYEGGDPGKRPKDCLKFQFKKPGVYAVSFSPDPLISCRRNGLPQDFTEIVDGPAKEPTEKPIVQDLPNIIRVKITRHRDGRSEEHWFF